MTNAEKFEEVFGIKIDEYPANICNIVDRFICKTKNGCTECELHHFWKKQYHEKKDIINGTPIKIGHWIDDNYDEIDVQHGRHIYRCSECNKYANDFIVGIENWWDLEKPNYCPWCGSKNGGDS